MCYKEGYQNHPSCMVCLVKDIKTGNLTTSCSLVAVDGMELSSNDPQVIEARKEALELLMSDHVGDCEAPCSLACPAKMNIPQMNRLIAANKFEESLQVVKKDIALPYVLGYICPAPCEKACRRKQVDDAVSICMLKRFVAAEYKTTISPRYKKNELNSTQYPSPLPNWGGAGGGVNVAIIGCGPAGLASAYYLLNYGYSCVLFDKNDNAGGTMRYSISDEELPKSAIDSEVDILRQLGAKFKFNYTVTKDNFETDILKKFDAVVIATGSLASDNWFVDLFETSKNGIAAEDGTLSTSKPGVFACGSVIRTHKMAVSSVAQGKAAAVSAHCYLQGKPFEKHVRKFNSHFTRLNPSEIDEYLKESVVDNRHKPNDGHLKGFTAIEAVKEAMRCMHCDCRKLDNCKLRDFSDQYKIDRKKYLIGDRKMMTKHYQHEDVVYEPEKCIKCGLCIDITLKSKELTGLTFVGRGFDVRMEASLDGTLKEGLTHTAQECVDACPTGALAWKTNIKYYLY
jgi:ferredoxin